MYAMHVQLCVYRSVKMVEIVLGRTHVTVRMDGRVCSAKPVSPGDSESTH